LVNARGSVEKMALRFAFCSLLFSDGFLLRFCFCFLLFAFWAPPRASAPGRGGAPVPSASRNARKPNAATPPCGKSPRFSRFNYFGRRLLGNLLRAAWRGQWRKALHGRICRVPPFAFTFEPPPPPTPTPPPLTHKFFAPPPPFLLTAQPIEVEVGLSS
jgi:hypothetical protein